MVSQSLYVTDASILFDVVNGGIGHEMFQLPSLFITSDLIADIELKKFPRFTDSTVKACEKKNYPNHKTPL